MIQKDIENIFLIIKVWYLYVVWFFYINSEYIYCEYFKGSVESWYFKVYFEEYDSYLVFGF